MAVEVSELKRFIYVLLAGDSTLQGLLGGATNPRIYADQVPQEAFDSGAVSIVYRVQSPGPDVNGVGTVRLMTEPLMRIVARRKGQPNAAQQQVDARMDAVLKVRASISGSHVISIQREFPVDSPDYDAANNRFHDVGGLYRGYVRA